MGNPNHDPKTGEFSDGGGSGGSAGTAHIAAALTGKNNGADGHIESLTARMTGFPSGGYYALDPSGQTMRGKAKYGEMPPSYKTFEKAHAVAMKARGK